MRSLVLGIDGQHEEGLLVRWFAAYDTFSTKGYHQADLDASLAFASVHLFTITTGWFQGFWDRPFAAISPGILEVAGGGVGGR
jgi:hypothetical protein